ncbi:MAG: heme biosynthesis HemY N-terminal domain-containing protein [Pseudomonadota bacterium]|nr:heme biosynthesis HemY N-terminal domain-containing protein [Pseudomonadota bacterium]
MKRALWFIFKLAILVALVIWLAEHPGTIILNWQGLVLSLPLGLFVLLLALLFVLLLGVRSVLIALEDGPAAWGRANSRRAIDRGQAALVKGWGALAAEDGKMALKYARAARGWLGDAPLVSDLTAKAAIKTGNLVTAKANFISLAHRPDTAALGETGLMRIALNEGDLDQALVHVRRAHEAAPHNAELARRHFEIAARLTVYDEAERALTDAEKGVAVTPDKARRHRAVLHLARSFDAGASEDGEKALEAAVKAVNVDPGFAPVAAHAALALHAADRKRQAEKTLEKAWKQSGHPDLIQAWDALDPGSDDLSKVVWMEKLAQWSPNHADGHLVAAAASMDARLWGEARTKLEAALAISPSVTACRMMARLAEESTGDSRAARDWLLKAADAPPVPHWRCAACKTVANEWATHCPACGAFDSLDWD